MKPGPIPIDQDQVLELAARVSGLLRGIGVLHAIYGSMAYRSVTGDEGVPANDIDVMVSDRDFAQVAEAVASLDLAPILTPSSIHANSRRFMGADGRPFDVSFDSFEHYFERHGLSLDRYIEIETGFGTVRVLNPEDLLRVYEIGLNGGNLVKLPEYERKALGLREFGR